MTDVRAATAEPVASSSTAQDEEEWDEGRLRQSVRKRTALVWLARVGVLVVILGVWQLVAGRVIDAFFTSSPTAIAARLWEWLLDGTIISNLLFTIQAMVLGFIIGSLSGILVGFVLGRIPFLARVLDPLIVSVYSLPKIALAPLFILWFGIGLLSKVVLAAVIVFFFLFYNTYSGVREVDRELVDVVRLMGGTRRHILSKVVLPSAATWIFAGLRLAVPYSLIGAVVGEIVASNRGLGYLLKRSSGVFDTAGVFASLAVLMVIATVLNMAVNQFERRTSRWNQAIN